MNIVIDNQIQGTAGKVVIAFAVIGAVTTVIKVSDAIRARKTTKNTK